jgi:hypothetical protein
MGLNHGWRGPNIVRDGLVLYLDAGSPNSYQGTGTTWKDISKVNQNNGTLTNGPTFNSGNGGSIVFDGVDDYVNCGSTTNLTGLIDISISSWVYPITPSFTSFVSRYYNTTPLQGWLLGYFNSSFTFDGRESSAAYLSTTSTNTFPINNWYNVVGTKAGSLWSIYVNGNLQSSSSLGNGTTPFSANSMQVGALLGAGFSIYQPTRVATTQIYNRALTASEILQNYNATKGRFGL